MTTTVSNLDPPDPSTKGSPLWDSPDPSTFTPDPWECDPDDLNVPESDSPDDSESDDDGLDDDTDHDDPLDSDDEIVWVPPTRKRKCRQCDGTGIMWDKRIARNRDCSHCDGYGQV